MSMDSIDKSIEVLTDSGFYADNLWHIDSVKGDFTDKERMQILSEAVNDPEVEKLIMQKIKLAVSKTIKY
jgi:muramoyltetrapeptide carboxypeptidase LdcA involved in peptidoglycan recycling